MDIHKKVGMTPGYIHTHLHASFGNFATMLCVCFWIQSCTQI